MTEAARPPNTPQSTRDRGEMILIIVQAVQTRRPIAMIQIHTFCWAPHATSYLAACDVLGCARRDLDNRTSGAGSTRAT